VPFAFGVGVQAPVAGVHVPVLQAFVRALQSTAVPVLHVSVARLHVSTPLHALPSLQSASFAHPHALLSTVQPPAASLQLSTVHAIPSLQVTAAPPQMPAVHTSPVVQALPSAHAVPVGFAGFEQSPEAGAHVPAVWHWSGAGQTTAPPLAHAPAWHVSDTVQPLPSLQAEPLAFAGFEQVPVTESHVPAVWHWSCAVQTTGLAPVQLPPWHVSV
jgi:hypothetical protein